MTTIRTNPQPRLRANLPNHCRGSSVQSDDSSLSGILLSWEKNGDYPLWPGCPNNYGANGDLVMLPTLAVKPQAVRRLGIKRYTYDPLALWTLHFLSAFKIVYFIEWFHGAPSYQVF